MRPAPPRTHKCLEPARRLLGTPRPCPEALLERTTAAAGHGRSAGPARSRRRCGLCSGNSSAATATASRRPCLLAVRRISTLVVDRQASPGHSARQRRGALVVTADVPPKPCPPFPLPRPSLRLSSHPSFISPFLPSFLVPLPPPFHTGVPQQAEELVTASCPFANH